MPNKTFLNLPLERQVEIIEICVEEFASHDFDSASLNRIIDKIGIAKGSFYRYFDNKTDVYEYILGYALDRKLSYIKDFNETDINYSGMKFSEKIIYRLIEFDFIYFNFSNFILSQANNIFLNICDLKNKEIFKDIVNELQEKHFIRTDIDIDLLIFVFKNLLFLRNFIIAKLNMPIEDLSKDPNAYKKYKNDIVLIVKQYSDLLTAGLKPINK